MGKNGTHYPYEKKINNYTIGIFLCDGQTARAGALHRPALKQVSE